MKQGDIIHLRLVNADEIIGELDYIDEKEIALKKPLVVSEREDPDSKVSTIMLSKYVLFEDNIAIPFSRNHVVTSTNVLDEIKRYYYNSLEFNEKYSEPSIKKEISRINDMMETMLLGKPVADPIEDDQIRIIFTPSSNTLH
jgi:hypothetical protein